MKNYFKPWHSWGIRSRLILLLATTLILSSFVGLAALDRLTQIRVAEFMESYEIDSAKQAKTMPPLSISEVSQQLQQAYQAGEWNRVKQVIAQPNFSSDQWLLVLVTSDQKSILQSSSIWQSMDARLVAGDIVIVFHQTAIAAKMVRTISVQNNDFLKPLIIDGKSIAHVFWLRLPNKALDNNKDQFLSQSRIASIMLACLILAGGSIVFTVLGRRITRPLRDLMHATKRIAAGELGLKVAISGADEVGQLASSFNEMSSRLAHIETLRKRMVSDVAHELRSPLTGLRCQIEAMRDGLIAADSTNLDVLFNEVIQLQSIVNDLQELTIAEANTIKLQIAPINLRELLNSVLRAVQHNNNSIRIEDQSLPPSYEFEADHLRLRQVLINVVQNAVKFSAEKGVINIYLTEDSASKSTLIRVRDFGDGVPPEDLENIFERFYRTDQARTSGQGGSGLGLAISRALMHQMGGSISANLPEGGGLEIVVKVEPQAKCS